MAKTAHAPVQGAKTKTQGSRVVNPIPNDDPNIAQSYKVIEGASLEEILRYAQMPGVELDFDLARFQELDDNFVALLPASAQKAYWLAKAEFEGRRKMADRALFETPTTVDPMSKLLDGPHGASNPLVRDSDMIQKLMPEYYVTWRVEGGQGDIENALKAGFRVVRHPLDDTERTTKSPLDWSGERWKIRDGTIDPISGEEIFNVMVYIRKKAWKDNLDAMSMISHNAYSTNKKQFVEGVDNISRDMLSSKERIQVSDLDEMHVEEHTLVQDGKRVQVRPDR